jgi:hypothetical protein
MKMPAAMASSPMITSRPLKLKLNNAISPYRMSQMDSKSMPMFFVNLFMKFSFLYNVFFEYRRFIHPSALVRTPAKVMSVCEQS